MLRYLFIYFFFVVGQYLSMCLKSFVSYKANSFYYLNKYTGRLFFNNFHDIKININWKVFYVGIKYSFVTNSSIYPSYSFSYLYNGVGYKRFTGQIWKQRGGELLIRLKKKYMFIHLKKIKFSFCVKWIIYSDCPHFIFTNIF